MLLRTPKFLSTKSNKACDQAGVHPRPCYPTQYCPSEDSAARADFRHRKNVGTRIVILRLEQTWTIKATLKVPLEKLTVLPLFALH
jgi:hypothetical protein